MGSKRVLILFSDLKRRPSISTMDLDPSIVITAQNIDQVFDYVVAEIKRDLNEQSASDGFIYFKDRTKDSIYRLTSQLTQLDGIASKLKHDNETLKAENKMLKKDNRNSQDDLTALREDIGVWQSKCELLKDDSPKIKELKSKVAAQYDQIKLFTSSRIEFAKTLNKTADECLKEINEPAIQLDTLNCQTDYEKELFTKLLSKLIAIKKSVIKLFQRKQKRMD